MQQALRQADMLEQRRYNDSNDPARRFGEECRPVDNRNKTSIILQYYIFGAFSLFENKTFIENRRRLLDHTARARWWRHYDVFISSSLVSDKSYFFADENKLYDVTDFFIEV